MMFAEADRLREEAELDTGGSAVRLAIIAGVEQGRRRSWQGRFSQSFFIGLAAAVIAAIILFFIPSLQNSAPRTAAPPAPGNWGQLEMFKGLYAFDIEAPTLDSAIRHNYLQMINKSAEAEGYKITLNAVTADENRIIYLYTATVTEGQEIYSINSARMMDQSTGFYLDSGGQIGGHNYGKSPGNNRIYYGRGIIDLDRNKPFPAALEADFQIASVDPGKLEDPKTGTVVADMHYSPRLKVAFKLDSKFKQQVTLVLQPEEDFMLDGIEVTLSKVEISPLLIRTEVKIKNEPDVTWRNRQKIFLAAYGDELQAVTKNGTVRLKMSGGSGNYEGFERRFASNLLDQPEKLNVIMKTDDGWKKNELVFPVLP